MYIKKNASFFIIILGHLGYKVCNCANGWDDFFSIIYVFNSLRSFYLVFLCFAYLGMKMSR